MCKSVKRLFFIVLAFTACSPLALTSEGEKRFQMTVPERGGILYVFPFKSDDSYSLQVWRTDTEIWLIKLGKDAIPGSIGQLPYDDTSIRDIEGAMILLARRPFASGGNTRIDRKMLNEIRSNGMVSSNQRWDGCFKFFPTSGREVAYFTRSCSK